MIQAPPKTGKSIFTAQMLDALAQHQGFLAWMPDKAWKCLYIQVDAPPGDWYGQLDQLDLSAGYTLDRTDLGLFFLDDPVKRDHLKATIKEHAFDLVAWDAAEKLSAQDLNKKEGCQLLLKHMHKVWAGPSILVHHPRKLSESANWRSVDEIAGHHYLAADASAILTLRGHGSKRASLNVIGRRAESKWTMQRDPRTYAWINAEPDLNENDPYGV